MPTKKPVRRVPMPSEARETLMGNQDLRGKGDSTAEQKKMLSFWVTLEQRDEIKSYAQRHHMSMSRLIIEGLEMRMKQE